MYREPNRGRVYFTQVTASTKDVGIIMASRCLVVGADRSSPHAFLRIRSDSRARGFTRGWRVFVRDALDDGSQFLLH